MKTNIVDHAETKIVSAERGTKTKLSWPLLVLVLISAALGAGGCEGTYTAYPGYGPYYGGYGRPYYGGYGPGYAPGYAAYPGSVTVEVGDRPYYTRGPGYYVGRAYYVWRPGHWRWRNGQRVWIHGHYVLR
jgi:WXXGXW repeat (2 copies)